jgi:hypothetical protein
MAQPWDGGGTRSYVKFFKILQQNWPECIAQEAIRSGLTHIIQSPAFVVESLKKPPKLLVSVWHAL